MARPKTYWPRCSVCQYMKKNRDFRLRVTQSTYFNEEGTESVMSVNHAFGSPFKAVTLYAHLTRHQPKDKTHYALIDPALPELANAIEGEVITGTLQERALRMVVAEGQKKILRGEMNVTANNLISAATALANIEKSTKDRRLETAKAFFTNGPEQTIPEQLETQLETQLGPGTQSGQTPS